MKKLLRDITSLISIACGKVNADMYFSNGRVVNVLTVMLQQGWYMDLVTGR